MKNVISCLAVNEGKVETWNWFDSFLIVV
jgi:hypothetical protein